MDRKCDIANCPKYVRQVLRVEEKLYYYCNEHFSRMTDELEKLQEKINKMSNKEMVQRLAELKGFKIVH